MGARGVPDHRWRGGRGDVGLRHVSWVRVTLSDAGMRCEAVGVGHRTPVVRRIAVASASRLIAEGVPSVVVRPRSSHATTATGRVPAPAGAEG